MKRRNFIKVSIRTGVVLVGISIVKYFYLFSRSARLTLIEFLTVSQVLTGKNDLNQTVGKKIYELFSLDPQFQTCLESIYREIRSSGKATSREHYDAKLKIISAWYTGIVLSQGEWVRVTYFDALMYRALKRTINPPTVCGGQIGYWALPPDRKNL